MQAAPALVRKRRERLFYIGMSIAVVITVFAGFARTYYLRPYFTTAPLMPLLHLHGLVFTSWLVLFVYRRRMHALLAELSSTRAKALAMPFTDTILSRTSTVSPGMPMTRLTV